MTFYSPYIVFDTRDGREICQCASIQDALMMISFNPGHRQYKQHKFILDQVVDIESEKLPDDRQLNPQRILSSPKGEPLNLTL